MVGADSQFAVVVMIAVIVCEQNEERSEVSASMLLIVKGASVAASHACLFTGRVRPAVPTA